MDYIDTICKHINYEIDIPQYIKLYRGVLKNAYFINQYPSFRRNRNLFLYFLFGLFIKKRILHSSKVYFHYTNKPAELRGFDGFDIVYYGKQNGLKGYISLPGLYAYMSNTEMIRLFIYSKKSHKYCDSNIPFFYWLEFLSFDYFLHKNDISILMTNDHYTKVGTSFSLLCEYRGISYMIKQHGFTIRGKSLPQRLYCSRVYAYDDLQASIFRECIIKNLDCEYINRYVDYIDFTNINCDRKIIAIIENKSPRMNEIIRKVIDATNNSEDKYYVFIQLHPMSKKGDYREYALEGVKFTRDRIGNAEVVVSPFSALFYNYLRSGYKGRIMLVDTEKMVIEFRGKYPNLEYYDGLSEFGKALNTIV